MIGIAVVDIVELVGPKGIGLAGSYFTYMSALPGGTSFSSFINGVLPIAFIMQLVFLRQIYHLHSRLVLPLFAQWNN